MHYLLPHAALKLKQGRVPFAVDMKITDDAGADQVEDIRQKVSRAAFEVGAAISGGSIDLGAGADTLTLGNFTNSLSATNVETVTGGTGWSGRPASRRRAELSGAWIFGGSPGAGDCGSCCACAPRNAPAQEICHDQTSGSPPAVG